MAIIQNPVIGRARKQAGGMVFSKMYDKNVMRAKPAQVTPSNTTPQQGQRAFITMLTGFAKGFSVDNLITLYPNKPASRSRYSELQKQLSAGRDVTGSEADIDFGLVPSLGNGIDVPIVSPHLNLGSTNLELSWDSTVTPSNLNASDKVFAVIFNRSTGQSFQSEASSSFSAEILAVPYPTGWTNVMSYAGYIGFISTKFKPGSELSSTVKRTDNS